MAVFSMSKSVSELANLIPDHPLRSDDLVKDVFPDLRVYCTERVVQQIDVSLLEDRPGQTHPLLLTTTQVDPLCVCVCERVCVCICEAPPIQ